MSSKGEREFLAYLARIAAAMESIDSKLDPKPKKKVTETKE